MRTRRRRVAIGTTIALALAGTMTAFAAWIVPDVGDAAGDARAITIPAANAPVATRVGAPNSDVVQLDWASVDLPGGAGVAAYVVSAYDDATNTPRPGQGACTGVIASLTCTESGVPVGTWRWTVTAVLGAWSGTESPKSDQLTIASLDTTPPTITSTSPGDGEIDVNTAGTVSATANEALAPATVNTDTFDLRGPDHTLVAATVAYDGPTMSLRLTPNSALSALTTYTATVHGGPSGIQDVAGNRLAADDTWTFTTAAAPPPSPDGGPGGPILVISGTSNPFGRYLAEILRAEGLNAFAVADVDSVTSSVLAQYRVAILGETPLTTAQAQMISDWVTIGGGDLIAMRPDPQLAGLLGLAPASGTLADAYLKVDTSTSPGAGIVDATMQYHGAADQYTLSGATAIATLYSDATTATAHPAVTLRPVGANGGHAAAFTFDLARSIVETRQGNPAWAGQERDGVAPIRSDDLFFGNAAGDPQPDWVDLTKVAIPQADEQQRLLANLVTNMTADQLPMPRFWYFPRGQKAVVVMTGDDHGNGGTSGRFAQDEALSPPGCNVDAWQCVRSTSYIYPGTPISDAQAAAFQAAGFEIGLHVNTNCADWDATSLTGFFDSQLAQLATQLPSVAVPATSRTHCIAWSDWSTQPDVELAHGIRLDTNYYYWPPSWVQDRPGFFTGSGMPMRFARLDGSMIDVYQATTQMTDESGQSYPATINTLLDRALGPDGYYGAFTANMHTDSADSSGSDAIVAAAQARGVPIVSARQLLTWIDGRNASTFGSLTFDGTHLAFALSVGAGANGLEAMLPATSGAKTLTTLEHGGTPVAFQTQTVKGVQYAMFPAVPGAYTATYTADTTPPVISNIAVAPTPTSATISWTTDEGATSTVEYGTTPALGHTASSAALTTSHSVAITALNPTTTYYYRVVSTDGATNTATSSTDTFATPTGQFLDTTTADFSAGSLSTAYVAETADGEATLAPTIGAEFGGSTLPPGWTSTPWASGGGATVGGGQLSVDGSLVAGAASPSFGPGRALEFVATFGAEPFQHVGFGTDLNGPPWAIFSTNNTTNTLYARTNNGTQQIDTPIGGEGGLLGAPHRFRIEWDATEVRYYVDGTLVATHAIAISASMRPLVSDVSPGGPQLTVDWLHMSPYAATGTVVSRVFDAGTTASFAPLTYSADLPTGTSVGLEVRTGNTSTPDGSWTAFTSVPNGGTVPGPAVRFVQYRATLTTGDPALTPDLAAVSIGFTTQPDTTPPTVTARQPAPGATGVPGDTNVTVTFDESVDNATLTPTSFRLRKHGDAGDVAATLNYDDTSRTATLHPTVPLDFGATYDVTVAATITDLAGNPLGTDDTWSFATQPLTFVDTTPADFGGGSLDAGASIADTQGGEVTLAPTLGTEFDATSLPASWQTRATPWTTGGAATVAFGSLSVDGTMATTVDQYTPGRSVEFTATFGAQPFEHVGLEADLDFNGPWAMFSTAATSDQLFVRTHTSTFNSDVAIAPPQPAGTWLGTPHRFRIDWGTTSITYSIDGTVVRTESVTIPDSLRVIASDFNTGAPPVAVDWVRVTPYANTGTFTSRVFDAGAPSAWGTLTWVDTEPPGTSVQAFVRIGDTPTPDGSWTPFTPINNGGAIPGTARYAQYQLVLTTTDTGLTPEVAQVTIGG